MLRVQMIDAVDYLKRKVKAAIKTLMNSKTGKLNLTMVSTG